MKFLLQSFISVGNMLKDMDIKDDIGYKTQVYFTWLDFLLKLLTAYSNVHNTPTSTISHLDCLTSNFGFSLLPYI